MKIKQIIMDTLDITLNESMTIGEMVANDFRKAEVFRKYGIDYCCGGKITLQQSCQKKGINFDEINQDLLAIDERKDRSEDYKSWDMDFLVDYIVNKHHKYVTNSHPMMLELSAKVARVHGDRHLELIEINRLFVEIAEELMSHMYKEENILFPFIKEIAKAKREGSELNRPAFGTIQNPINMMESEHVSAGGSLEEIKELSLNFTPPEDACNSYRVFFSKLNEYEQDLHHHIHLENNILFPKAIAAEKELLK
jgi:regulator of cell morphogenesis and NO signaling